MNGEEQLAFHRCLNLSSISLPESVTAIGQVAFYRCTKLEKVAIHRGVKKLEAQTFVDCPGLKSISLSKGLKEIDDGVFWDCTRLKTITIPASVTKIHEKAFRGMRGHDHLREASGMIRFTPSTVTFRPNAAGPVDSRRRPRATGHGSPGLEPHGSAVAILPSRSFCR